MKRRTKHRLATLCLIFALVVALMGLLVGCSTTRTYSMPYAFAEDRLFERLHLEINTTLETPGRVQAKADGDLEGPMAMKRYAVDLHGHTSGESLSLTLSHRYNIGASGGEYIQFELARITDSETRITVNYTDRWWGMWPPFVFWNPGPFREKRIHAAIWGNEVANKSAQVIP